jgi:hypothetical protein
MTTRTDSYFQGFYDYIIHGSDTNIGTTPNTKEYRFGAAEARSYIDRLPCRFWDAAEKPLYYLGYFDGILGNPMNSRLAGLGQGYEVGFDAGREYRSEFDIPHTVLNQQIQATLLDLYLAMNRDAMRSIKLKRDHSLDPQTREHNQGRADALRVLLTELRVRPQVYDWLCRQAGDLTQQWIDLETTTAYIPKREG